MANSLVEVANRIIRENPEKTQQARGDKKAARWFVGQIIKATDGAYREFEIGQVLARRGIHAPPPGPLPPPAPVPDKFG